MDALMIVEGDPGALDGGESRGEIRISVRRLKVIQTNRSEKQISKETNKQRIKKITKK